MTWYQVSRKHRMVARFPEGKTGKQALLDAANAATDAAPNLDAKMRAYWRADHERWVNALGERQAGDQFLRVYATGDLVRTLDSAEWADFIRKGGKTYDGVTENTGNPEEKSR